MDSWAQFQWICSNKSLPSTKSLCSANKDFQPECTCSIMFITTDWLPHEFYFAHKFDEQYFLLHTFTKLGPRCKNDIGWRSSEGWNSVKMMTGSHISEYEQWSGFLSLYFFQYRILLWVRVHAQKSRLKCEHEYLTFWPTRDSVHFFRRQIHKKGIENEFRN